MVEKTSVDGDWVTVEGSVTPGNHIRPVGDDVAANDLVFSNGSVLGAGHLGVLCSLGINEIATYPRPRVGVISAGDELVDDVGAWNLANYLTRTDELLSLNVATGC